MKTICRTCLSSSNELSCLEIDKNLKNMIELLTTIQISQDSIEYPSTICQNCIENFNKYYCFRIVVIQADKELKERFKTHVTRKAEKKILCRRKRKGLSKDSASPKRKKIQEVEETNYKFKVKIKQESSEHVSEAKVCDNQKNVEIPSYRVTRQRFNKQSDEAGINNLEEFVGNDLNEALKHDILSPTSKASRRNGETDLKKSSNSADSFHDISDEENSDSKQDLKINNKIKNHSSLTCEECDLTFSTRSELINHRRNHHTAPGICNICGAVVRADNLSKHVQTHSQEPVVCKICGRLLKNPQSLRTHLLIHKGITYTCDICGRTSKVKSEHSRHMKTHVDPNARKTMCPICGKRVRHLKHHMLTHTGEKPHTCKHCHKGFTSTYSLKVHSRQHTNEKPFICECCSMGFNQKISLLSHLESKHSAGRMG
ncbi:unnamed protein product [Phaedon cochleariae]|uniref:Uncharacterized protein n=1 Tax=Phaedon cochleariae TaxID=80249 RepID=A0A9P0DNI2_PHACE|nr:unnamed protein product [Phaedon cochleariae]